MKKVWFTADTHFGHKKIPFYACRKFCLDSQELLTLDSIFKNKNFHTEWSPSWASISRMDDYLIKKINDHVGKDDILWHLGDFCWGKKNNAEEVARKYRERINCRNIFLVAGNHDSEDIKKIFSDCFETYDLELNSKHIVLSHFAHAFWNKSHNGSWMLYGHAHGTAESWLDLNMPGRLSMDVGVDNMFNILGEYRPISFDEINLIFSSRKGFCVDGNKLKSALQSSKLN